MYKNTLFCTYYICSKSITALICIQNSRSQKRFKVYSSLNFFSRSIFEHTLHTYIMFWCFRFLCSTTSSFENASLKKQNTLIRPFCSINFFLQIFFSPLLRIWFGESFHFWLGTSQLSSIEKYGTRRKTA